MLHARAEGFCFRFCQAGSWGNLRGYLGAITSISAQCGGGSVSGEEFLRDCEALGVWAGRGRR